jgi:hypothetical protein
MRDSVMAYGQFEERIKMVVSHFWAHRPLTAGPSLLAFRVGCKTMVVWSGGRTKSVLYDLKLTLRYALVTVLTE